MAVEILKHGTVIAQFAAPQEIVIDHANDSIRVGDGTDLMGPLTNVGGVLCFPVAIKDIAAGTLATNAAQTDGTQKAQIVQGGSTAEVTDVGGEKALKVSVISTVGGGAAPAHTDDAVFTVGVHEVTAIGGVYQSSPDSVDDGDAGALRMTVDRLLMVQLKELAAGLEIPIKDNGNSITVDGPVTDAELRATPVPVSGTFYQATQPISAVSLPLPTGASTEATLADIKTSVQLLDDLVATDDAAFAVGSKVAPIGAVMDDTGTDTVDEGDIGYLRMTSQRQLWTVVGAISAGDNNIGNVDIASALPAGDNNIGNVDVVTLPALPTGSNAIGKLAANSGVDIGDVDVLSMPAVAGAAAHDAAVSGNPVRIAGRAMLANGTAVAEDDTADIATDNQGRVIVTPHVPRDLVLQGTATLTTTGETTILAAVASTFLDVTKLVLTNSSTTATRVQVRDATSGTIRMEVALAANGGAVIDFGSVPMIQTAVNNNWTVQLSGAVTSIYCFAQAVKRIA